MSESPFMPAHSVQGPNECEHSFHSFHSVKLQSTGAFGLTSGKSAWSSSSRTCYQIQFCSIFDITQVGSWKRKLHIQELDRISGWGNKSILHELTWQSRPLLFRQTPRWRRVVPYCAVKLWDLSGICPEFALTPMHWTSSRPWESSQQNSLMSHSQMGLQTGYSLRNLWNWAWDPVKQEAVSLREFKEQACHCGSTCTADTPIQLWHRLFNSWTIRDHLFLSCIGFVSSCYIATSLHFLGPSKLSVRIWFQLISQCHLDPHNVLHWSLSVESSWLQYLPGPVPGRLGWKKGSQKGFYMIIKAR